MENLVFEGEHDVEVYVGDCIECGPQYNMLNLNICKRSHTFCDFCYENVYRLSGCETCHQMDTEEDRTYYMNNPVIDRTVCGWKPVGCDFVSKDPIVLERHKKGCTFRSICCESFIFGLGSCYWVGSISGVYQHFEEAHPDSITSLINDSLVVAKFSLKKEQRSLHLIKYENELFYYKHKLDLKKNKFYVAVQMLGLEEVANKFFYHYVVKAGDRVMNMLEMCHSDGMESNHIFQTEKCAVIPVKTLERYVVEEKLWFEFKITKVV